MKDKSMLGMLSAEGDQMAVAGMKSMVEPKVCYLIRK
jgi:hypothetical protein